MTKEELLEIGLPKIKRFNDLSKDLDFRDNDPTIPHFSGILAKIGDQIKIECTKLSTILNEYVTCDTFIDNKDIIEKIVINDLIKRDEILNLIREIENKINWDYVNKSLLTIEKTLVPITEDEPELLL